jgi:hypothetical protein
MKIIQFIIITACFLFSGGACLFFPLKVKEIFLGYHKLDKEYDFGDPTTWLRYEPRLWYFRAIGIFMLLVALALLIGFFNSQNQ